MFSFATLFGARTEHKAAKRAIERAAAGDIAYARKLASKIAALPVQQLLPLHDAWRAVYGPAGYPTLTVGRTRYFMLPAAAAEAGRASDAVRDKIWAIDLCSEAPDLDAGWGPTLRAVYNVVQAVGYRSLIGEETYRELSEPWRRAFGEPIPTAGSSASVVSETADYTLHRLAPYHAHGVTAPDALCVTHFTFGENVMDALKVPRLWRVAPGVRIMVGQAELGSDILLRLDHGSQSGYQDGHGSYCNLRYRFHVLDGELAGRCIRLDYWAGALGNSHALVVPAADQMSNWA